MRTDSTRISEEARSAAKKEIEKQYGEQYYENRYYRTNQSAQDAHEGIRPTYIDLNPEDIKNDLNSDEYKLYKLIYNRFLASQMKAAVYDTITANIDVNNYNFRASGQSLKFKGFMTLYVETLDNKTDENEESFVPDLKEGQEVIKQKIEPKQSFTEPPPRYTEASLVKALEEKGIGRPSTYVPTISTLLSREYIVREKKNLMATELGFIVNNILSEYFKQIVDVDFTAAMEGKLDNIEEGSESWTNVVEEFFAPLKVAIDKAEKEVSKVVIEDKVSDVPCDKCGKMMVIKHGRYGDFLACPGYPECKNAKPIVEELDVDCPKCGGKVLVKRSKKGKKFFGCSNYPDCDFVSWNEPVKDKCEECGSYMVLKYSKTKGKYVQCSNSECGNIKIIEEKEKDN